MPSFLLQEKFLEIAREFSDKTALQIREGENKYFSYSYAEAARLAKLAGLYLIGQGIKKGDRVAIILENGPDWPIFYFGILLSGATAVPIDTQLTALEIKNIIADSEAKLIICRSPQAAYGANARTADEVLGALKEMALPADLDFPKADIEDLASIIYTSGTTSNPKGVALTHRNFSSNIESLYELEIVSKADNIISILPLHHSYAFTVTLLLPLSLGATVTYIKTLKPEEILSAMRETGITMLVGVPQLYYLLHKGIMEKVNKMPALSRILLKPFIAKKIRGAFGSKLRIMASGGARLEPKVARALSGLGFKVLEGYGLTETSPIVAFNPLKRQKFGSVGLPVPGVEVKISNRGEDAAGEILIKGPNVMKGYYRKPKETDEVIKNGWFHSGDLGYINKDGYLFITGRLKEIIVLSNGKNIYPEEIEAHYQRCRFIKELCVLGTVKDEMSQSEELGAVIVPNMDSFISAGSVAIRDNIKWDLENFSRELPYYKRIMGFVIAKDGLPRTRLGKIKRHEVKKLYEGQFDSQGALPSSGKAAEDALLTSPAGKKTIEVLAKVKKITRPITAEDHLELDLGIDSLARVELVVGLEKIFGINIPEGTMTQVFTIRDMILKVEELASQKTGPQTGIRTASGQVMWKEILMKDPPEKIKSKIDLSPEALSKIATLILMGFLCLVFRGIFRLRVSGRENIPQKSPYILCPNHSSYLDAFAVCASVPFACEMNLFFLGYRVYFDQPVIRRLIKLMRVVPIDPSDDLLNAMEATSFIIRNDKSLCIFPEGQRSIDGEVKAFKKGIGIITKELNPLLVPVYIDGAFKAWPRNRMLPAAFPIKVIFGKPVNKEYLLRAGRAALSSASSGGLGTPSDIASSVGGDDYEAIAEGLRLEILKLKGTV